MCARRGPTGGEREAVWENQKRLLKVEQRCTGRKRQGKGRKNSIYKGIDSLMDKLIYSSYLY